MHWNRKATLDKEDWDRNKYVLLRWENSRITPQEIPGRHKHTSGDKVVTRATMAATATTIVGPCRSIVASSSNSDNNAVSVSNVNAIMSNVIHILQHRDNFSPMH